MARLVLCGECGAVLNGSCCPYCGEGEERPARYRGQPNRNRSIKRKNEPAVTDAHGRPIRLG
jgi:hypothetical protein